MPPGYTAAPGSGGTPARCHEQRIVEQGIERPDREERRRQAAQVRVERRHGGVGAILAAGHEPVGVSLDDGRRENEIARAPLARARRQGQVVGAVGERRSGEWCEPCRSRRRAGWQREMGAGRLAPMARSVPPNSRCATHHPERCGFAVVGSRGIWVLGRQAIPDAHGGELVASTTAFSSVLLVDAEPIRRGGGERPRPRRTQHAKRQGRRTVDDRISPRAAGRSVEPSACDVLARRRDRDVEDARRGGERRGELFEVRRDGVDGRGREPAGSTAVPTVVMRAARRRRGGRRSPEPRRAGPDARLALTTRASL